MSVVKGFIGPHSDDWFTKTGELSHKGLRVLKTALNSPQEHFTVALGVNEFKRQLDKIPFITKGQRTETVCRYKIKAWTEYKEIVQYKGSFPSHPAY